MDGGDKAPIIYGIEYQVRVGCDGVSSQLSEYMIASTVSVSIDIQSGKDASVNKYVHVGAKLQCRRYNSLIEMLELILLAYVALILFEWCCMLYKIAKVARF